MARKDKKANSRLQPNAPEFQQVFQQPPHNPYYPDLNSSGSQPIPPPTYQESTVSISANNNRRQQPVQMSHISATGDNVNYTRYYDQPNQRGPSVIIQQVPYNHRAERYSRNVKSFNTRLVLTAILAAISSLFAYNLFKERPCLFDFTVHKPNKDLKISIRDVRDMHINVVYSSAVVVLLCLVKSAVGFSSKSHSCFLFLTSLLTLFLSILTGYLAYLTFYSPCALKTNEIFTNIGKTLIGALSDSLPSPDQGIFGESNVFQVADEDRKGVVIFAVNMINFVSYFASFLTSLFMC